MRSLIEFTQQQGVGAVILALPAQRKAALWLGLPVNRYFCFSPDQFGEIMEEIDAGIDELRNPR